MSKYRIPPDAWRQSTTVLMRYPQTKRDLSQAIDEAMTRDPERDKGGVKPSHPDPTATSGIRLYSSQRYQRMRREVKAVEDALKGIDSIERDVISQRYWDHKHKTAYERIDAPYSVRQMQRIVQRVMYRIAVNLGEI